MSIENLSDEQLDSRLDTIQSMIANADTKSLPSLNKIFQKLIDEQARRDMTPITFEVSLLVPAGISKREMVKYIREAIVCWKGGKDPEMPISMLEAKSVKVKLKGIK